MEKQASAIVKEQAVNGAHEKTTQRFFSLDVFRGITICLMIIVNTPGKGAQLYADLVHAQWFGFTLADLVFPSFLFAVGNAMSFSMPRLEDAGEKVFFRKIIKRTLIIFLLGYLMYWFPFVQQTIDGSWIMKPISETRIMGVLQRIALCYFAAALLVHYFSQRTTMIIAAILLLSYWAFLYLFGERGNELSMEGNAITRLDLFLLGESHVYKKDRMSFDPEGLLSTIPAIVNVLTGYWTGLFLQRKGKSYSGLFGLVMAGVAAVAVAMLWQVVFPVSKKLWTSSFVLYTAGIDMLFLTMLVYWIEIKRRTGGTNFFNILGKNPLFIYLLSELLYVVLTMIELPDGQSLFAWISTAVFQRLLPGPLGSLVTAIAFMLLCWMVAWWLDKKKIYIRI